MKAIGVIKRPGLCQTTISVQPPTIAELMNESAATSSSFPNYVAAVTPSGIPLYVGMLNWFCFAGWTR
jgi:hypothetical protein